MSPFYTCMLSNMIHKRKVKIGVMIKCQIKITLYLCKLTILRLATYFQERECKPLLYLVLFQSRPILILVSSTKAYSVTNAKPDLKLMSTRGVMAGSAGVLVLKP